jgi:short/branched chain acyl-CoA dehydrogenase
MGIEIPEEYGGSGAPFFNVCLTIEELSRVDPVVGLLCDLQNTVVNNVIVVRFLRDFP